MERIYLQQNSLLIRWADNMNQKSTILLVNKPIHGRAQDWNMPIFDKNFPGLRHGCARHEYSIARILLLWREDHVFKDKRIHAPIAHTLNSV